MTSRLAWLLLVMAFAVPGCAHLRTRTPEDAHEFVLPKDPTPVASAGMLEEEPTSAEATPEGQEPRTARTGPKLPVLPVPDAEPKAEEEPEAKGADEVQHAEYSEPTPTDKAELTKKYAPLCEALQCILDERHQDALKHLQAYDAETQEFYLRVLPTLTVFARKKLGELSSQEVAVLTDQLHSLLGQLRPRSELVIEKACYCEWIKAYGVYKPLPEGHAFLAATPERPAGELVQIYVELRNFASEPRDGYFETRLHGSAEIRDSADRIVEVFDFKDHNELRRSRSRVNDCSVSYGFSVPRTLAPGTYRLVLQLADETVPGSRRLARKSLPFRVTPVSARTASR